MAQQNKVKRIIGRHFRWVVIGAVGAIIVVGIAFIVLLLRWPFSEADVAQSLGESVSGSITFAKFRATYIPFPGCVAENAVVRRSPSPAGTPPLATIQRIAIQSRYVDLFFRPSYISRIVLNGLYVRIPPRGSGAKSAKENTSSSKLRVGEIDADGATLEIERKHVKTPLKFEIHHLTVKSVAAHSPMRYVAKLRNPLPPGEIISTGSFGPLNSHDPAQTPLSGTAIFEYANLSAFKGIAGTLSSDQDFYGTLGRIEVNGKVNIPDFKLTKTDNHAPLASEFHLTVNAMNGDVSLQQVDTTLVRTRILAHGSIAGKPGRKGKTTSIDLTIDKGRIQDVLYLFSTAKHPPMDGVANFRAQITVPPLGRPLLREVRAHADFQIGDGRFEKPSTQANVNKLSARARGEKVDSKSDKAIGGRAPSPENVIASLQGRVVLRGGIASFPRLVFTVPGASARMFGTFNLSNDDINFHGKLKTQVSFSQTLGGGIKSVLLKPLDPFFKKKSAGAAVPVYMLGTYDYPRFGIDILGDHDEKKSRGSGDEKRKSSGDSNRNSMF
ncbi:MAG TPA: AsmA-like C-terminal region-containing protein [Candidatus Acidoferrales bacterium]|nr:AsmA-like C-terminal region-containing protein [Candidatus Acidoferrales bacterium]